MQPNSRPTQKGNRQSTSKGVASWVVLIIIGVLVLAVAIFMIASSSCSRQAAPGEPEEPQAQSAEEPVETDDDAMPSTYSFELPEL